MNARGLLMLAQLSAALLMAWNASAEQPPDSLHRFPASPPKLASPRPFDQLGWASVPGPTPRTGRSGLEALTDGESSRGCIPPPGLRGEGGWVPLPAPSLQYHTAIYDSRRNRIVAFGGAPYAFYDDYAGYPLSNRTWTLSLDGPAVWKELLPTGLAPPSRLGHSAVYDPVRDRMLVFGGSSDVFGAPPYLSDVWALSLSGEPTWTKLEVSGPQPPPRTGHSAIYDPIHDAMIVFGSSGGGGYEAPLNDTWSLSLTKNPTWSRLEFSGLVPPARTAGLTAYPAVFDPVHREMVMVGRGDGQGVDVWALSLAGNLSWRRMSVSGAVPPTRGDPSSVYDEAGGRLILFGGYAPGTTLNETWALALSREPSWVKLSPADSPPSPRFGHAAVYDPHRHRMVVIGGAVNREQGMDTWALSLKGPVKWSALIDGGPAPWGRVDHTAVLDIAQQRMVIFGGWSYEFGQPMGDVWSLSLTGSHAWSSLDDALPAGNIPGGRVGHSAIYDPVRQRMLIFGGSDVDGRLVNDVWVLSLAGAPVWSQLTPDGEPPSARFAHRAIYDPAGDRMIVFGGLDSAAMRSDVWALSLSGSPVWTQLLPQGPGPAARAAYGMVYDPLGKRVIVHGGTDNHQLYDDTWALSLNGQPVWSQISALAPPSVLRFYHTAVYDPQGQRMVIWGGSHHGVDLSDTWALALTGPPVWTEVPPTNETPEPRSGHSAVYVPSDGRMIVFGGSFDLNDAWALPLAGPRGRASWDGELAQVQGSSSLALGEPRPNPSRGESVVDFTLPYASRVTLAVYDAAGRRVRQIANGEFSSGAHGLRWDGRDANGHPSPTGLYFLTLEASGGSITRKAVIAR